MKEELLLSSCTFFYKKKGNKKVRLKYPKSLENHKAQFPMLSVFVGQKLILCHYHIQNAKNGV